MAASILSSLSETCWDHNVFLSFRGEDSKNFTDHLYRALVQAGIHTFRDDKELPREKIISTELLQMFENRLRLLIKIDMAKAGRWREALTKAGGFSGWDFGSVANG